MPGKITGNIIGRITGNIIGRIPGKVSGKITGLIVSSALLACVISSFALLTGCSSPSSGTGGFVVKESETPVSAGDETTVILFAAKSLNKVMEEVIGLYETEHPGVRIIGNYDSSGTLMTQIQEGAACDVFFSAAQKQMNRLEEEGLLADGTRKNVVNNQVCVVTYPGSETEVKGLDTLSKAKNMALADGSVPVGNYTRKALMKAGILAESEDPSAYTTAEVSEALGGIEINECANVGAVTTAVSEGSNEVGTVYKSDTYGLEDKLEILEVVSYDLTGDVIYPVSQVINKEADETEKKAAADFTSFITSDEAKALFDKYLFDTDVE
ncbi:MAG: molybdate ABC transporter substrate-binding protein [Lachnospiraceae bacterium]|nr:molybdate ABC transporter substrate-binding protein [Lachnospiraceae bacterium]